MSSVDTIILPNGNDYKFQDIVSPYTTCTGTLTNISGGAGIMGASVQEQTGKKITLSTELKDGNLSTLATASRGNTTSREYAVGLDKNSVLSVNVPWTNTTYSSGTNTTISSNKVSVCNIGDADNELGAGGTNTNINHNTWTYVISSTDTYQFPVGVYILKGYIQWHTYNSSSGGTAAQTRQGYRWLVFSYTANSGTTINRFSTSTIKAYSSATNQVIRQECVFVWNNTTADRQVRLNAWQNSGGPLMYRYSGYQWVRIK